MQLQYNTGTNKQYNGNIAYQYWQAPGINNNYTYTYDKLNRLMSGTASDGYTENNISYDVMGNISTLKRYQASTLIDQLTYTYTSGNQLASIADASGSNSGLVNGTTSYIYDGNGNMLSNTNSTNTGQNKSFTYNLLNLPLVATTATFGTSTYTYDATGNKLKKVNVLGGNTITTEYISGIQYKNSITAVDFIQTEEGKAVPATGGTYDYYYYLGDNLGNTRLTFHTNTGTAQMLQQDDYYPYGLEIPRNTYSPKNEYLYNKKELQEELGQYDYGARFYDPVIARWTTVDPMAEMSRRWSPYNYVMNNPIRLVDVDGMYPGEGELEQQSDKRVKMENDIKYAAPGENTTYTYENGEKTSVQNWPKINDVVGVNDFVPHRRVGGKDVNCLILADEQLAKSGYKDAGKMIQTYTEKSGADLANSTRAVSYINSELQKGVPVVVGVDAFTSTNGYIVTKKNEKYGDDATDHFIVIVGSGSDSKGDYYHFFDNSTDNHQTGTSANNKLYYDKTTGLISGNTSTGYANPSSVPYAHSYIVSQVRQSDSE